MPVRPQSLGTGKAAPFLSPGPTIDLPADATSRDAVLAHRPDLDGIRGFAIIAVVMYHAGGWTLPGAFVGVDLFFVLSGYLITQIVVERQRRQVFSMADFYVRRARRILPALFTVLAATTVLGLLCLTPPELKTFAYSMASAAGFVSNMFLLHLPDGYFEPNNALTPLLMSWSLSVEAQYYLLFPLLFLPLMRRFFEPRRAVLVLFVLSFACACVVLTKSHKATFYLLPTRAWELLLGAWVAFLPPLPKSRWVHEIVGCIGLGLIVGSLLLLHSYMPFPGWNALAPCIGTALLLVSSNSWINARFLSWPPLVFLGLISYSIYLWHWPLLSFSWVIWGKEFELAKLGTLLAATLILAGLTYRFVERPARMSRAPAHISAAGYATATAALVISGLLIGQWRGLPGRMDPDGQHLLAQSNLEVPLVEAAKEWSDAMMSPLPGNCFRIFGEPQFSGDCTTAVTDGRGTALLWGDSHAAHYFPGLAQHLASQGYGLRLASMGACRPYKFKDKHYNDPFKRACEDRNRAVMDTIVQHPEINPIILAGRWSAYAANEPKNLVRFDREMRGLIEELRHLGRAVIILGESPGFRSGPIQCLLRHHLQLAPAASCDASFDLVEKQQAPTRAILSSVAQASRACVVDTRAHFCSSGSCSPFLEGGVAAFWDGNHLTRDGSIWLAKDHAFDSCDGDWNSAKAAPAMAAQTVIEPLAESSPASPPAKSPSS